MSAQIVPPAAPESSGDKSKSASPGCTRRRCKGKGCKGNHGSRAWRTRRSDQARQYKRSQEIIALFHAGYSYGTIAEVLSCSERTARDAVEADFGERYEDHKDERLERTRLMDSMLMLVIRGNMQGLGMGEGPQSRHIIQAVVAKAKLWGDMAPTRLEGSFKVEGGVRPVSPFGQFEPMIVAALCRAVSRGEMGQLAQALEALPDGGADLLKNVTPGSSGDLQAAGGSERIGETPLEEAPV